MPVEVFSNMQAADLGAMKIKRFVRRPAGLPPGLVKKMPLKVKRMPVVEPIEKVAEKLPAVQAAQIATEVKSTPAMASRVRLLLKSKDPEVAIHQDQWKAITEARQPGTFPESAGQWPAMTKFVIGREKAYLAHLAGLGATEKGTQAREGTEKLLTTAGTAAAGAGIYGQLFAAALDFAKPALVKNVGLIVDKKTKDKKAATPVATQQAEVQQTVKAMETEYQASAAKALPNTIAPPPAAEGFGAGAIAPIGAAAFIALMLLGKK